ncbi:GL24566 [Drosophila persimilis]|uniref:Serine/threonine-protein phosphatase n=2 Tax=pseudoobscura subgroup TaxID=32358 RepID=B5DPJ5_DROPS|nr:serine/threonine-protein phosphatase PP1 [Drosophila persimilis]XP_002134946.1 serine/threonine-protein phosphatase PP1 [Drosophila pseudoobscura]EDW30485.1 GL24566 [Drosophila persimilis]
MSYMHTDRLTNEYEVFNANIESIINKLVNCDNPHNGLNLSENQLRFVCYFARRALLDEKSLLRIAPPLKICGDIHGQFSDLLRIFHLGGPIPKQKYLFLGDYVDRGKLSVETLTLLLAYKVRYPNQIFLLRGNHESAKVNRVYGFFDECKRRYSVNLFRSFVAAYDCMPLAAVVGQRIFCAHGGISPRMHCLNDIEDVERPLEVPDVGLVCDLLWSDPDDRNPGWGENERGVSYTFGHNVVNLFCKRMKIDLIVRAHQVVADGYDFFSRQLITIFSAPNYAGMFDNAGAIMNVDANLIITFIIIKPTYTVTRGGPGASMEATGRNRNF